MKKHKLLNVVLLCFTGIFYILGNKLGTITYVIASISLIIWAILFCGKIKNY